MYVLTQFCHFKSKNHRLMIVHIYTSNCFFLSGQFLDAHSTIEWKNEMILSTNHIQAFSLQLLNDIYIMLSIYCLKWCACLYTWDLLGLHTNEAFLWESYFFILLSIIHVQPDSSNLQFLLIRNYYHTTVWDHCKNINFAYID